MDDAASQPLVRSLSDALDKRRAPGGRRWPVALAAQDRDLRYVWAFNPGTAGTEGVVGLTDADLFPDDFQILTTLKRHVMETGRDMHHQMWVARPSGRVFLDLTLEPLQDEAGKVTGVFTTSVDLTAQRYVHEAYRRTEAHLKYLLLLSDAVGPLEDPAAIQEVAARLLGERLAADGVFYAELTPGDDGFIVHAAYHQPGAQGLAGYHAFPSGARPLLSGLRKAKAVWSADVENDPALSPKTRQMCVTAGVRAFIAVPLLRHKRLVAMLVAHHPEPREWIQEDLDLARQTADRAWHAARRVRAESEAREQRRMLDLAMAAGHVVPFEIDLTTGALKPSPGLYALFGIEARHSHRPRPDWRNYVNEEDRALIDRSVERSHTDGAEHHLEYRVDHPDGTIHWHETHAIPVADGKGRFVRLVGFITDITERKRTEEALRESEERYRHIAEHLQSALFDVPTEFGPVKLGHLYHSATEAALVGGDFYDVFEAKDGRIAVLIGDVSGHGVQAARTATMVKDVIHAFTHQSIRPHEVLRRTNLLLVEKEMAGFVSLFLGILEPETGILHYASAGHPEPLLRRTTGEVELLGSGSTPLGVEPEAQWRPGAAEMQEGDMVVLYTDGVLEARREGEMFGQERLEALVKRKRLTVQRLPHLVLDQVLAFSEGTLRDDVAVLALSLTAKEPLTPRPFVQERLLD